MAETNVTHPVSGSNSHVPVIEPSISPDSMDSNNSPESGSENTTHDPKIAESVEEKPNQIGGDYTDESVAKDSDRGDPVREGNDSPEFVESMYESKGEEKASDVVQSSASLPSKETVEHDQLDNEDQSLAIEILPSHSIDFEQSLSFFCLISNSKFHETSDKDEEPIVSKKMARGRTTSSAKKVGSRNVRTSLDPKRESVHKGEFASSRYVHKSVPVWIVMLLSSLHPTERELLQ